MLPARSRIARLRSLQCTTGNRPRWFYKALCRNFENDVFPIGSRQKLGFQRQFSNVSRQLQHASFSGITESTIYALSSAPGRAAIAVIRISGPGCLDVYVQLCPGKAFPKPRVATVRSLLEPGATPTADAVLDASALILYFPAPASATGEDVLELHVHGGPATVRAVLAGIAKCRVGAEAQQLNVRYAEPGEFTRRAFMNERLSLPHIEALGETLAAETEQQRRLAARGSNSRLAARYEAWRQQLLLARGELEALIDFSEDQHFDESPAELCASVAQQVQALLHLLHMHTQNAMRGELLRHGIQISLLGAPNAGKSSLLNRIVGREAAIVSNQAGTTRDVVEVGLDLGGYFCRLADTAGLRRCMGAVGELSRQIPDQASSSIDQIEREGMRRARARAAESDVVLVLLSLEEPPSSSVASPDGPVLHLDAEVCETTADLIRTKANVMLVINKMDLARNDPGVESRAVAAALAAVPGLARHDVHCISCLPSSQASDGLPRPNASVTDPEDLVDGSRGADARQISDGDGIQALLHALTHRFAMLTTALVPDASANLASSTPSAHTLSASSTTNPSPSSPSSLSSVADLSVWQESLGTTARQRLLLESCSTELHAALALMRPCARNPNIAPNHARATALVATDILSNDDDEIDIVLAAEHLRAAAADLARITGRSSDVDDVEQVLGVVFEKFCVGK